MQLPARGDLYGELKDLAPNGPREVRLELGARKSRTKSADETGCAMHQFGAS